MVLRRLSGHWNSCLQLPSRGIMTDLPTAQRFLIWTTVLPFSRRLYCIVYGVTSRARLWSLPHVGRKVACVICNYYVSSKSCQLSTVSWHFALFQLLQDPDILPLRGHVPHNLAYSLFQQLQYNNISITSGMNKICCITYQSFFTRMSYFCLIVSQVWFDFGCFLR